MDGAKEARYVRWRRAEPLDGRSPAAEEREDVGRGGRELAVKRRGRSNVRMMRGCSEHGSGNDGTVAGLGYDIGRSLLLLSVSVYATLFAPAGLQGLR